jgi:hypothetical protein
VSALKEEYTKEEVLALDEMFRQLTDMPAWEQLTQFIEGMKSQLVLAGLADYDRPTEVARRHGLYTGYSALLELPAQFREAAQRHRETEMQAERERLAEEARRRRRATVEGEVAF